MLKHYCEELYASIYLNMLYPSIASQNLGSLPSSDRVPSLSTIFCAALHVTIGTPSSPLSSVPGDTTPPSDMVVSAPWPHDDGLSPCSNGNRPPRGHDCNSFLSCPYCDKQNLFANKCWQQFGKPPTSQAVVTPSATLSPTSPSIHTPQYHVTLTSVEYEALRCSKSTYASSSSARLTSLSVPFTLGTSALLASCSPSWIINSSTSSHMTRTPSLVSSYHPTPSHPPITIVDGWPCPIQSHATTYVTDSLSLHRILINLLSISALPYTVALFPFHCIFKDLYIRQRNGLGREDGQDIYELAFDEPSLSLWDIFVTYMTTSSLYWHCSLGHRCFEKLKKTLPWLSLTQFVCESC